MAMALLAAVEEMEEDCFHSILYLTVWLYTFAPCCSDHLSSTFQALADPTRRAILARLSRVRHRLPSWRLPSA